jgi:hypothetical protein
MTVKEFLAAVQKGTITTSVGGHMSTQDANSFINLVKENNPLYGTEVQLIPMTAPSKRIEIIDLASRIMRSGVEGVAPTDTFSPTISNRTLEVKEVLLPYDVTFDFLEENIEAQDADALLQKMFTTQFGNDQIDLSINGDEALAETITDTTPADGVDDTSGFTQTDHTFLRINDGWVKKLKADAAAHAAVLGDSTSRDYKGVLFPALIDNLPEKYLRDLTKLSFYVNPMAERAYRRQLSERETVLADAILTEGRRVKFEGIDIVPVPSWPTHVPVLSAKLNFAVGVSRSIRVGRQIQERKRIIEYTITAKTDAEYAVGDQISYTVLTD